MRNTVGVDFPDPVVLYYSFNFLVARDKMKFVQEV